MLLSKLVTYLNFLEVYSKFYLKSYLLNLIIPIPLPGQVYMGRKKDTNELFAIKIQSKEKLIQAGLSEFFKQEADLILIGDHTWLVKLYFAFQDFQFLYYVLEIMSGGDLETLFEAQKNFDEETAKFYIAEIATVGHLSID